jgi:hypothetical protein
VDSPRWATDPKTTVFRETLQSARQGGPAGLPGRHAPAALSRPVLAAMFARSLGGVAPEEAVEWAAALRGICGA